MFFYHPGYYGHRIGMTSSCHLPHRARCEEYLQSTKVLEHCRCSEGQSHKIVIGFLLNTSIAKITGLSNNVNIVDFSCAILIILTPNMENCVKSLLGFHGYQHNQPIQVGPEKKINDII